MVLTHVTQIVLHNILLCKKLLTHSASYLQKALLLLVLLLLLLLLLLSLLLLLPSLFSSRAEVRTISSAQFKKPKHW